MDGEGTRLGQEAALRLRDFRSSFEPGLYQTDIICCGVTLVDYFTNEFGQPHERHNLRWARAFGPQPTVEFWSDLVS